VFFIGKVKLAYKIDTRNSVLLDYTGLSETIAMSELRYLPQTMTELTEPGDIKSMQKLVDLLEEDDDVQNVYHNWEETE